MGLKQREDEANCRNACQHNFGMYVTRQKKKYWLFNLNAAIE